MTVDVKKLLDPADPDTLTQIGGNLYVAKWSKLGVPMLDKIVMETHDGIIITRDWYEPLTLPGWTAIEFRILYTQRGPDGESITT